jgi:gliding motility-associated-like protein
MNRFGCDSVLITHYVFVKPDAVWLKDTTVCSLQDTGVKKKVLTNFRGCDSIVMQRFRWGVDSTFFFESVCDTTKIRFVKAVHKNRWKCDSLVITNYFFDIYKCLETIKIYDWIIPNDGDNLNDFLYIPHVERLLDNELVVFDYQGELVYQARGYKNNWAGTDKHGNPLPAGLYRYVFMVPDAKGAELWRKNGVIRIDYVP